MVAQSVPGKQYLGLDDGNERASTADGDVALEANAAS